MRGDRATWAAIGAGALFLLLLAAAGMAGLSVVPSLLAAWLFVLSLPAGALLLVTGIEATAPDESPVLSWLPPLRALLPLMPAAALLGLPVLLLQASLFDPGAWPAAGIGRIWFARGPFSVRMVLFLLLWSWLALSFARPGTRRASAGAGLALMLATGTMAAFDWTMAVEPGLASSSFGLLVLSGQAVSAIAAAALAAPSNARPGIATPLLMLVSVWAFLHFTQFLVVWSANEPAEASWYLHRIGGLGAAVLWLGAALLPGALILLLPGGPATRWVRPLAAVALLVRLLESFWLITPAFRHVFRITVADLLALLTMAALLAGLSRLTAALPARGARHVRS